MALRQLFGHQYLRSEMIPHVWIELMKFLCQGCGRILAHDGVRVKAVCVECGVMTDLRDQGFKRSEHVQKRQEIPSEDTILDEPPDDAQDDAKLKPVVSDINVISKTPAMDLKRVIPETFQSSNDDDGLAYGVGEVGDFYCPGCSRIMVSGSIVCVNCGFHLNKGNKLQRKHVVIDRSWTEGFSRFSRMMSCGIFCGVVGLLLVVGGELGEGGSRFTVVFAFIAMIQAVVLMGTYGALDLKRNSRGQIKLRRWYWVLFFPVHQTDQTVNGYDGVKMTQTSTGSLIDQILCFILLIPFVVPAILWYCFQIHRSVYEVALTRDRGRMVNRVFISREEDKALEIARILKELTGLPLNDV